MAYYIHFGAHTYLDPSDPQQPDYTLHDDQSHSLFLQLETLHSAVQLTLILTETDFEYLRRNVDFDTELPYSPDEEITALGICLEANECRQLAAALLVAAEKLT